MNVCVCVNETEIESEWEEERRERVSKMKLFSNSAFSFIVLLARPYNNSKIVCTMTHLSVVLITVHL